MNTPTICIKDLTARANDTNMSAKMLRDTIEGIAHLHCVYPFLCLCNTGDNCFNGVNVE